MTCLYTLIVRCIIDLYFINFCTILFPDSSFADNMYIPLGNSFMEMWSSFRKTIFVRPLVSVIVPPILLFEMIVSFVINVCFSCCLAMVLFEIFNPLKWI